MVLRIKRIYEDSSDDDGYRVLVDRIWPRGVSKERAHLDEWLKEVGPSNELRQWFHHEEPKWKEFRERYFAELETNPALSDLRHTIDQNPIVTLLYSARSETENQAVVVKDFLSR